MESDSPIPLECPTTDPRMRSAAQCPPYLGPFQGSCSPRGTETPASFTDPRPRSSSKPGSQMGKVGTHKEKEKKIEEHLPNSVLLLIKQTCLTGPADISVPNARIINI